MRKILTTYLPASMLLAFLTMVLLTCGGGGGDGGGAPKTLTGLSVSGPASMSEYGAATYTATANWDDNTTSTVTPTWSVNLQTASISTGGVLSCAGIDADQAVTITATYSSGGVDEMATMDVTVTNIATIPFTAQMVSGNAFFEENLSLGGDYDSTLSILNADSSFEQYTYEIPPDTADSVTGNWSIDSSGNLVININGQGTVTVGLISDSSTDMQVVVDDGTEPPPMVTLEKTIPADDAILPGTYVNQFGDTWIFNADGTGSTTGDGGWTYTWSVDSGILKVVFVANNYVGSLYVRAGSQTSPTSYTLLKWGFVIHTPAGGFGSYYGGMELTPQ